MRGGVSRVGGCMAVLTVALQATFGGYTQGFRVCHLKERSFMFSVASKSVGFHIYNAGRVIEKDFEMVFSLWGNGGPNWRREELMFYKEEDDEWTLIGRNGRALVANSGDHRSGSPERERWSVFQRLSGGNQSGRDPGTSQIIVSHNSELNVPESEWQGPVNENYLAIMLARSAIRVGSRGTSHGSAWRPSLLGFGHSSRLSLSRALQTAPRLLER